MYVRLFAKNFPSVPNKHGGWNKRGGWIKHVGKFDKRDAPNKRVDGFVFIFYEKKDLVIQAHFTQIFQEK
jgi:hypothetical protein